MISPTPRRVLVAGCGYVGSAAAALLAGAGERVWGLRRNPASIPEGVEPLAVDLLDPALDARLPESLDVVLFTASSDGGGEAAYRSIYLEGLDRLLRVLEARPVPRGREGKATRVLFTSSTAVYGDAQGDWVDEESATDPESYRGEIMLQAEARLLASPVEGIVLRLGGIYGPGRTRLIDAVRRGDATVPAGGPLWSNRIHRDDAAGALVHLAALPDPHPVYLGVDAEPAPMEEIYRWLAAGMGVEPPRPDPTAGRRRGNKRCSSARLQASGYRFLHPTFREGFGALLEAGAGADRQDGPEGRGAREDPGPGSSRASRAGEER